MVLCDVAKYDEDWPQVGQVRRRKDGITSVEWFTYERKKWRPCRIRNKFAWVDNVNDEDIFFRGFNLTKAGKLPSSAKDALKIYSWKKSPSMC